MAKITAIRQRGSARNKPFQLDCIAHNDSGRYVTQKTNPVLPKARDHRLAADRFLLANQLKRLNSPAPPAAMKAINETQTHAPWR